MISFKNALELNNLSCEEREYLEELKCDIEGGVDEECEISFALSHFCLIPRVFDYGRYSFIYPIALSERADETSALLSINEYCMREEIERVITDTPKESLPLFFELFRHLDLDAEDKDGESFRVRIKTECELLTEAFNLNFCDLVLGKMNSDYDKDYARLARDEKTNEFFGYDYRQDFSENVPDSFFRENAESEFAAGTALTLAISYKGDFVGEVTLYAFDAMGGAEMAIRLLPEARGKHVGDLSFEALLSYARKIGLTKILAYVDARNEISLSYLSKNMTKISETPERVKFSYDLID